MNDVVHRQLKETDIQCVHECRIYRNYQEHTHASWLFLSDVSSWSVKERTAKAKVAGLFENSTLRIIRNAGQPASRLRLPNSLNPLVFLNIC